VKLLFDENLSHYLVGRLEVLFPHSVHVRDVGLERADDRAIWAYAMAHDHAIVSKDEDFAERALLEGPPPKVVWIRIGNCTTPTVDALLRSHCEELVVFAADTEAALIVLP
jgi:predicted nuclease of predicted toxin-antitoxin system